MQLARIAAGAAAAGCFAAFGLLHSLVEHGHTAAFDRRWLSAPRTADAEPRPGARWALVMRGLTELGGPVVRYLIAAPLVFLLWHSGSLAPAFWLVATLASGWIADAVAKKIFHRKRPSIVPHLARAGGPSFPSGHTFNTLLVYSALAIAFAPLFGSWLVAVLAGCLLLSFAVAFSRVWLGVHWPTDVAAGWLLGAGWLSGAVAVGFACIDG